MDQLWRDSSFFLIDGLAISRKLLWR